MGAGRAAILAAAALGIVAIPAAAQEADAPAAVSEVPGPSTQPPARFWTALGSEVRRYGNDSLGLLTTPLSWTRQDREKAAAAGLVLGGLFLADRSIDRQAQETRSPLTNSVSRATTPLGAEGGFGISAALIAAGFVFQDPGMPRSASSVCAKPDRVASTSRSTP